MEPGDSGGPLFDLDGKVVGIRSQIQQSVKENFDIPIASFRLYWDQLQKEEEFKIDRIPGLPDLGLEARRMRRGTARVSSIVPDGPAARAGLEVDDLITKTEGSDDRGSVLDRITSRYLSGDREIELEVTRAEQSKKVILTLPPNELEVTAVNDSREANEERVTVGDLAKELQALESQKDDVTAVIRSDKNDESIDVFGVFVAQPGCVVAKSSCVGEKPLVRNDKGDWLRQRYWLAMSPMISCCSALRCKTQRTSKWMSR